MASPVVVGTNATANAGTAATSHNVLHPNLAPGAGRLLLVFGRVGAGAAAVTLPAGWTVFYDTSDASDDTTFWAYRNTFTDGSEIGPLPGPATVLCTVTHASAKCALVVVLVSGAADPATRPPQAGAYAIGATAAPNSPVVTPTGGSKDYLFLTATSHTPDLDQTVDPAGYAWFIRIGGGGGSSATQAKIIVASKAATAASDDPGAWTLSGAATWTAWTVAVHPPAAGGPTTHSRSAALSLVGLIATIGRELLARSVVLNATGLVASSGVRVVPATERSAALVATGLITSVGRELLPRSAALNATGLVATRGIKIKSRSAALNAAGGIATVGRETISRSAALSATAAIASAGREQLARLAELGAAAQISVSGQIEGGLVVVTRSAALSATGAIASVGRELLPRRTVVTATASVAAVARRRLHRSSAVTATGQVSVAGEILGATARAAQVAAAGTVAVRPQRALSRSATVTTAATVSVVGRITLSRSAALTTAAAITTTTGKTGQAEFTAIATITLSRYLEPGYLTSTGSGRIAVIYHGQLDAGSLGGLEFPGPDEGELAVGTVGGIARTGG